MLVRALADAATDGERESARRLLVEARLWAGNTAGAFDEAVRLMKSADHASAGGVLAALALLGSPNPDEERARLLLDEVKKIVDTDRDAKADWRGSYNAATFLLDFAECPLSVETSSKVAPQLGGVPASPYRTTILGRLLVKILTRANELIGKGNEDAGLKLVWPIMSAGNVPGDNLIGKPIELKGGWLERTAPAAQHWTQVARTLAAIGKADFDRNGGGAKLMGYWLAAEVARQSPEAVNRPEQLIQFATGLAGLSRPPSDRKAGSPLSNADTLQLAILKQAQSLAVQDAQRMAIVDLLIGNISRYQQAGELETGLAQFVELELIKQIKPGERLRLVEDFDSLPPGAAAHKLLSYLADRFTELGAIQFQKAVATFATEPNREVNHYDGAAIDLYGQLAAALSAILSNRRGNRDRPALRRRPIVGGRVGCRDSILCASSWERRPLGRHPHEVNPGAAGRGPSACRRASDRQGAFAARQRSVGRAAQTRGGQLDCRHSLRGNPGR